VANPPTLQAKLAGPVAGQVPASPELGSGQRAPSPQAADLIDREPDRASWIGKQWPPSRQITPRTARFHQASALDKLGAGSRLDLVRLLP
jgi:hypothetical protein